MPFTLPGLPYGFDALEPFIDKETMMIHHGKHHQAYVDKLNAAVENTEYAVKSIEKIIAGIDSVDESIQIAVRNNGGGHLNHSMFWKIMAPNSGGKPDGDLLKSIEKDFGSFEAFQDVFKNAAATQFGSGWAWLCTDKTGKLLVTKNANQDNPISVGLRPILGLDVWEHAYYLKYQNKRPDYVDAWWNVVNWKEVENNYNTAK